MANANTAHSKNYAPKPPGRPISVLLYADEAQRFTPLVSREGGIKKAFLALLAQADMPETDPGVTSPEDPVSTDKEDSPR